MFTYWLLKIVTHLHFVATPHQLINKINIIINTAKIRLATPSNQNNHYLYYQLLSKSCNSKKYNSSPSFQHCGVFILKPSITFSAYCEYSMATISCSQVHLSASSKVWVSASCLQSTPPEWNLYVLTLPKVYYYFTNLPSQVGDRVFPVYRLEPRKVYTVVSGDCSILLQQHPILSVSMVQNRNVMHLYTKSDKL